MATTNWATNHPLARKHWADELVKEALQQTMMLKFMGSDSSSIIHVKPETEKGKGDKVTFGLRTQLVGDGVADSNTLEGNEEALNYYSDSVVLGGLRHAVRVDNFLGAQRVPFEVRNDAKNALADWLADRLDTAILNQLAGYTVQSDTRYTGGNAAVAPSTKLIWDDSAAENHTNETSLSESDVFTLAHIDYCVEKAKTRGRSGDGACPIRPVRYKGEDLYVMFIHPNQRTSLQRKVGSNTFFDLQRALLEGGQGPKQNALFTGGELMYNNTIVHVSSRVPYGVNGSSALTRVRRAVFCGAQAAAMCFGKGYAGAKANWTEESFDYESQLGVACDILFGAKKTVFNSTDFGVITVPTFAAAAF